MKREDRKYRFVIALFVIGIIGVMSFGTYEEWELKRTRKLTKGIITDISYFKRGKYSIHYVFLVKGRKYRGKTNTHYFECIEDEKQCIGKKFKVAYSSENPDNNEMNLGNYEKYKSRMRFFSIDWKGNYEE